MYLMPKLWTDEKGAVVTEYALLISCIAAAIAVAVSLLGGIVQALYQSAANVLNR